MNNPHNFNLHHLFRNNDKNPPANGDAPTITQKKALSMSSPIVIFGLLFACFLTFSASADPACEPLNTPPASESTIEESGKSTSNSSCCGHSQNEAASQTAAPQSPVFAFITPGGQTIVPTHEQLTAINTVLLQVSGPAAALKPVNFSTTPDTPAESTAPADSPQDSAAVAAVDESGNLVLPTDEQIRQAFPAADRRAQEAQPELIDPSDPSQGVKMRAAESFSLARIDQDGNIAFECVTPGVHAHSDHETGGADELDARTDTEN